MAERLEDYWARVGPGLDRLIRNEANRDVEMLMEHTIAFMAHTVEGLQTTATRNAELLGTLDSLDVLAFDALRSAHQAQRVLSLAGTAVAARLCFEGCCSMRIITEAGPDAATYANRYARWRHVETLEYFRKIGEPLPWEELIQHATEAAEWLQPDTFRVRDGAHWLNVPRFGNLFAIADFLGLSRDYRQIYSSGSSFVHASSTPSRVYRVGTELRHVAPAVHVSRYGVSAAVFALRLHRAFLTFHGVPFDLDEVTRLLARTLAVAEALHAGP